MCMYCMDKCKNENGQRERDPEDLAHVANSESIARRANQKSPGGIDVAVCSAKSIRQTIRLELQAEFLSDILRLLF